MDIHRSSPLRCLAALVLRLLTLTAISSARVEKRRSSFANLNQDEFAIQPARELDNKR
jgi:hypothetical protein